MKRRAMPRGRAGAWTLAAALALVAGGPAALAQRGGDPIRPEPSQGVLRAIEVPYLRPPEKAALRVFHGLGTEADLADPALRAQAALAAGVLDDPSLRDEKAAALDRAEAALRRGETDSCLALVGEEASPRAARLRAEALEELGRVDEAKAACGPVVRRLQTTKAQRADELVEGVRAMELLARLEGKPSRDYQSMLSLLIRAQEELDRLYWPAIAMQARLLYDKDNSGEAAQACFETLKLNASSVEVLELLGRISVDAFNFAGTEDVAKRLDELEARFAPESPRPSPAGQVMLARARLRQNDPAGAMEHVRAVLGRYPEHREALALEVAATAVLYDYDKMEALLSRFDERSPGSPRALFEAGKVLSDSRQYEKSAEILGRAIERRPNWATPYIELGLMQMQAGRETDALTALRRAKQLDEFNVRAGNSLDLVEELSGYSVVESEHFVVRARPGVDSVMAREMLGPLEEIHRIVAGGVRHEPSRKTTIEVMPDHEMFAVRIAGVTGIHTMAASTGPVIAMEAPRIGKKNTGEYDWVRVVRHEYVHTVTLSRTNNRIPHWFTEAAAVHYENAPRDQPTCELLEAALANDALFDMDEINIAFVRPKRQTDRAQAYAQGHWMYEYILYRWGEGAPLELMDLYATGVREREAMPKVLGVSQEDFLRDFTEWAKRDARSWGALAEPTVLALLLEETLADPARREGVARELEAFAFDWGMALGATGPSGLSQPEPFRADVVEPTPEVVERLLARHPEHPDLLQLSVGEALRVRGGAADEAMIPLLERYAAARQYDATPHKQLARLYLASDEPARAIPHLEYLDVREQRSASYAIELARQYGALERWDEAQAKAERATQIAPFDAGYREFAATVALKRRDLATAERHIAALVELEPGQDVHVKRLERIRQMRAGG